MKLDLLTLASATLHSQCGELFCKACFQYILNSHFLEGPFSVTHGPATLPCINIRVVIKNAQYGFCLQIVITEMSTSAALISFEVWIYMGQVSS